MTVETKPLPSRFPSVTFRPVREEFVLGRKLLAGGFLLSILGLVLFALLQAQHAALVPLAQERESLEAQLRQLKNDYQKVAATALAEAARAEAVKLLRDDRLPTTDALQTLSSLLVPGVTVEGLVLENTGRLVLKVRAADLASAADFLDKLDLWGKGIPYLDARAGGEWSVQPTPFTRDSQGTGYTATVELLPRKAAEAKAQPPASGETPAQGGSMK
ncbi:MAG: hypothetical protein BLITH_0315 [Brockia lithotrophica]|uniref:Uncharacterized protein n=1 Tax=Brockia lithotrophica TaxID=933949 RepID=A0A2T5GAM2_9BACL|nr:hypothetical protein [Brockia lithotrophica]PTQ53235.1 MAG: hypothetical protein BLITH_0315 [Brockia lithotrophica]